MKLALFDLDHTLLPIDSDHSWGEFTMELGWTDPQEFQRRNDDFFAQYRAGTLDIHAYVRFALDAVCRRGPDEARRAHQRFMREVIEPVMHPQAHALVRQHRQAGETVMIVTATNEFVTRPIAQAFGVDELIAVELQTDGPAGSGWYTGAIRGVPSIREGKVARVEDWLGRRGLRWQDVQTTFYSDSLNDLSLLERVNHPVATNPEPGLRALANQRGWPILDLFS